ncbi:MAG: hypothetical protein IAE89_02260 [Anaerolineae bacterium]|nr:hypothetical protein [Anaerolineae bacterium]
MLRKNPFYPDYHYDKVLLKGDPSTLRHDIVSRILRALWLRFLKLLIFPRALLTCDIFIFVSGTHLLPFRLDYLLLRLCRKQIVSIFVGSDIRCAEAFEQEMRELGVLEEIQPFINFVYSLENSHYPAKRRIVQAAERYSTLILSQPGYGQVHQRPYMRFTVPLDTAQFKFHIPDRVVPLVVHIPSRPEVKGTDKVLEAVEQLRAEGLAFEFRLIQNTPNAQVRELLSESDIVIDELYSETVAVLSTEAMATGNAVLVRYMADYANVPEGCPAVNVTKDTLAEKLRELIENRALRRSLALAGRPYVEANNDHLKITQQILDWLAEEKISDYDFMPTFYQQFKQAGR